jgi:hypothetical protein
VIAAGLSFAVDDRAPGTGVARRVSLGATGRLAVAQRVRAAENRTTNRENSTNSWYAAAADAQERVTMLLRRATPL